MFAFQRGVAVVLTGDPGMETSHVLQDIALTLKILMALDVISKLPFLFLFPFTLCLCVVLVKVRRGCQRSRDELKADVRHECGCWD